ncbi:hypothetical protein C6P40_000514 [Pichia californica]|uniref:CASTOR ACT domain-containing protein n=1 Tax=Pichia californica TaxID=460514 RepID=A0A9P6WKL9_9ASCO|nr:hypothetical protein C6P42_001700 [[Candida] californica]KAG0688810.1 hypothetical protein C6P40_000514 [[Candida] californica]
MIDSTETQLFTSKISILTIPRDNFWIFKSGILEILYVLIDVYENRSNSRYSDNDISSLSSSSDDKSFDDNYISNSNLNLNLNKNSYDAISNSNSNNLINNELDSFSDSRSINNLYNDNQIEDDGYFFHLAFTTEEITLMCSTKLIKKYLNKAMKLDSNSTLISDEFFIIQVFSDGSNIGKKILELTKPLSLNNISLFFISNYFSDLVLIPIKDKSKTLKILNQIEYEGENDSYKEARSDDLELKTFELFKENNIKPKLVTDVKLVLTGARSGDCVEILKQTAESISRLNTEDLKKGNKKNFPEYFAITRTPTEEIGLLLPYDYNELNKLKFSKNNIMGSLEDYYYPIFIDLKKLPLDLKGIVSGMASKLLRMDIDEMSYLSLGKSGIVLIPDMFREQVEDKLDF